MTKVSDFPEGYDVDEFLKSCSAIWNAGLNPPEAIPASKKINGIQYRLFAWTEIDDAPMIQKDLETIKTLTKARHITSIKLQKKYQCVYIA